nr:unnamed protein product [Callosobruchus chinensis]
MGGVDLSDLLVGLYDMDRKLLKWWKKRLYGGPSKLSKTCLNLPVSDETTEHNLEPHAIVEESYDTISIQAESTETAYLIISTHKRNTPTTVAEDTENASKMNSNTRPLTEEELLAIIDDESYWEDFEVDDSSSEIIPEANDA